MPKLHIHDIDLYYEITGHGQPVLFIHGLGSSTRDWEAQVRFFSKHYQVITFDVRGHGKSDKPPGPYSVPLFAADTTELIKLIGLASVHVVGISMGGMIAFQLAVNTSNLVKSLVIVNSSPEFIVRTFLERLEVFRRLLIVRLMGMRKMGKVLSKRLFPNQEHGELRRILVKRWAENNKRAYIDSLKAIVGWSVADRLGTIDCPTLVIAADEDYTPVAFKQAYVSKMPRAELLVISDSRHFTPVEKPERFNEVLLAFLSKQT